MSFRCVGPSPRLSRLALPPAFVLTQIIYPHIPLHQHHTPLPQLPLTNGRPFPPPPPPPPPASPAADPWYLKTVFEDDKTAAEPPVCDTEGCSEAAVALWSTQVSKQLWKTCERCQEADFGGWPDGVKPPPAQARLLAPPPPPKSDAYAAFSPQSHPPTSTPTPAPALTPATVQGATTANPNPHKKLKKKKRNPFSPAEVNALAFGANRFRNTTNGKVPWPTVLEAYKHVFHPDRNSVGLSQKYKALDSNGKLPTEVRFAPCGL